MIVAWPEGMSVLYVLVVCTRYKWEGLSFYEQCPLIQHLLTMVLPTRHRPFPDLDHAPYLQIPFQW